MNNEPCGGLDNVDDGCGMVFRWRTSAGCHCPLCKKLKVPGLSEEAKAEIKVPSSLLSMACLLKVNQEKMVQCSECGLCGTTIGNPCGTCKRLGIDIANIQYNLEMTDKWSFKHTKRLT